MSTCDCEKQDGFANCCYRKKAEQEVVKLESRVKRLTEALKFYAEPTSIEPFLFEVKIKGTENTRPSISMNFYRLARTALKESDE